MKRGGVWSKPFTVMMVLASVFSVGIVPAYAIHKAIGLYHNRWALIMIGLMNSILCGVRFWCNETIAAKS